MNFLNYFFYFRFIVAYFVLPETENCTLEEIEMHFSDKSKGLTDIRIEKIENYMEKCDEIVP